MLSVLVLIAVGFVIYKIASKKKNQPKDDSFEANGLTPTAGKVKSKAALAKINAPVSHGVIGWTYQQLVERYGTENLVKKEYKSTADGIENESAAAAIRKVEEGRVSVCEVEGVYRWDVPGRMSFSLDKNNIVIDATWYSDILTEVSIAKMTEIRRELESVYGGATKDGDKDMGYSWDWVSADDIFITLAGTIDDSTGSNRYSDVYISTSRATEQMKKNLQAR
jgi:hypothetical protein